jgi:folate-binding protein YgfZ
MSDTTPFDSLPLDILLHHAAFAPLPSIAWLRITGEDRTRWLNGMTTNGVQTLAPGQGCYTFFLNAQGRIQHDATLFAEPHSLLLETSVTQLEPLVAMLDRYIIMDDVELALLPTHAGLLLAGPEAEAALLALDLAVPPVGLHLAGDRTHHVDVVRAYSPLIPRFELWSNAEVIAGLNEKLVELRIPQASTDDLEKLRILEGTPLFGIDIRDRDLPQETAPSGTQSRALHFSKGCYLGQEIVERIHSRGSLHRTFAGFTLSGPAPAPGTSLFSGAQPDKPIGELTSIAEVTLDGKRAVVALGYIRRETLDRGEPIHSAGGEARPAALPFSIEPRQPAPASNVH